MSYAPQLIPRPQFQVTMAKPSSYIEKKNSALFDMYAELQIAQASKEFRSGKTQTVRGAALPPAWMQP